VRIENAEVRVFLDLEDDLKARFFGKEKKTEA
jgi:hypothetical protein